MVTKYTKDGHPYGEAPYTPEEEEWLDRHMDGGDGPFTVVYSGPAGDRYRDRYKAPPSKQEQKDQPPKEDDFLD